MEFSTDNLKPLAQQLAALVSTELMNAEEDVTVRYIETELRHRLQEIGRLALGEVLREADVDSERSIACECPVADRLDAVAGRCSTNAAAAPRC